MQSNEYVNCSYSRRICDTLITFINYNNNCYYVVFISFFPYALSNYQWLSRCNCTTAL